MGNILRVFRHDEESSSSSVSRPTTRRPRITTTTTEPYWQWHGRHNHTIAPSSNTSSIKHPGTSAANMTNLPSKDMKLGSNAALGAAIGISAGIFVLLGILTLLVLLHRRRSQMVKQNHPADVENSASFSYHPYDEIQDTAATSTGRSKDIRNYELLATGVGYSVEVEYQEIGNVTSTAVQPTSADNTYEVETAIDSAMHSCEPYEDLLDTTKNSSKQLQNPESSCYVLEAAVNFADRTIEPYEEIGRSRSAEVSQLNHVTDYNYEEVRDATRTFMEQPKVADTTYELETAVDKTTARDGPNAGIGSSDFSVIYAQPYELERASSINDYELETAVASSP